MLILRPALPFSLLLLSSVSVPSIAQAAESNAVDDRQVSNASSVDADADATKPATSRTPIAHVLVSTGFGRSSISAAPTAFVDLLFVARLGALAVGGNAQAMAIFFDGSAVAAAGSAGVFVPGLPRDVDVGLLASLGARHYSGIEADFIFGDDPGASATLGFASARLLAAKHFGSGAQRFTLGFQAFGDTDLARVSKTYTYRDTFLTTTTETATHRVGGVNLGGMLGLGATIN